MNKIARDLLLEPGLDGELVGEDAAGDRPGHGEHLDVGREDADLGRGARLAETGAAGHAVGVLSAAKELLESPRTSWVRLFLLI